MMTGKVTQVNDTAKTLTVTVKGKAVTCSAANLKVRLPTVGQVGDITYTENPGGPMATSTIKSTKSNTSD